MATQLKSLQGLAIKGRMARPANNEAFVSGTINGDNMTVAFASQNRVQVSPRKWKHERHTRFVKLERVFTDSGDDFWWEPRTSMEFTHDGTMLNS